MTQPSSDSHGAAETPWYPPAETAEKSLRLYVARDLASKAGHRLDDLPDPSRNTYTIQAEAATLALLNWVATNAPAAVQPLRASGLLVWTVEDGFGDRKAD